MKKQFKKECAKLIAKIAMRNGKKEAEATCRFIYHQPKVTKELKKSL